MANTTNFGWETPDDTDLVKDGAAAMRTLGGAIDTSMMDLKGGTSGQILSKNSNTDMDFTWIANDQGDITGVTAGTGLSGGGTTGAVTLSIDTGTTVDKTTAQTLTNKTLSSPVISSISNTGTLTLPTSTDTLVGRATTDTLTNKTLTSPTINGAFTNSVNEIIARGFEEDVNVVASAATGTINFNIETASIWYYTSNATANHTLNFRYNSTTTLSSKLAVGDAITLVWMNTNGTTAYYPSTIQIDGSSVTPKVPASITAGNASAIDAYTFTIIKTAATPTYTVLETQTKFA